MGHEINAIYRLELLGFFGVFEEERESILPLLSNVKDLTNT